MFWSWRSAPRGSQLLPSRGLLIDLFGAGRLAVGLGAVGFAGLAAGLLGLVSGLALGEGGGLALADAGRLVELTAEALVLGLQVAETSLKGLAASTGDGLHTFIIGEVRAAAALPRSRGRDQLELDALDKYRPARFRGRKSASTPRRPLGLFLASFPNAPRAVSCFTRGKALRRKSKNDGRPTLPSVKQEIALGLHPPGAARSSLSIPPCFSSPSP